MSPPRTYECPEGSDRHYGIAVASVTDAAGNHLNWEKSNAGDGIQLKIGDPLDEKNHVGPLIDKDAVKNYNQALERIAAEGIQALTNSIGGKYRFANIVLSGGGAHLFRKALRDAFKKQPVLELADPFYANVRGFQRAGVDRLRAQAPTDASQGAHHEAQ